MKATDRALYEALFDELLEDEKLAELPCALIDAALRGDDALSEVLSGDSRELVRPTRSTGTEATEGPSVFLKEITVEGFRGAGPEAKLSVPPGPGLTLVVGRNGTGKSTFAEGLETVLTGTTDRWKERKEWEDAWRNVGYDGASRVTATLMAEGLGTCIASRSWEPSAELSTGRFDVTPESTEGAKLNWKSSCETSKPFLSYRRLGTVVDDPASVFDTLHEVLGLELIADASGRIDARLKVLTDRGKEEKAKRKFAADSLKAASDERATELHVLLDTNKPKLDGIRSSLQAARTSAKGCHPSIQRVAASNPPESSEWAAARDELEQAIAGVQSASTAAAEQSQEVIAALDAALLILERDPSSCPVCLSPLDGGGIAGVRERRATLQEASKSFATAKRAVSGALTKVVDLAGRLPALDEEFSSQIVVPEAVMTAVASMGAFRDQTPERVAACVAEHIEALGRLTELREQARRHLAEADEQFQRLIQPVQQWLELAETVDTEKPTVQALKKSKTWLNDATDRHRDKRFEPLKEATLQNWTMMSSGSSVLLNTVRLAGRKNRRKLELGVEVDGHEASGVGVLSQGEINCMALSLFLPKAIHADGPFRFVVIDDPVQAMDQVKVDGLARVLSEAAKKLQVVVLTHDARLMASLRRLQLPCTVLEVRRTAGATLLVQECEPPHERFIRDALRLAKGDGLGSELPQRLVPYFCRTAVESACNQRVFRDRLDEGHTFADIEDELANVKSLFSRVACALLGDADRGDQVVPHLKSHRGRGEADALFSMKETHGSGSSLSADELSTLAHRTRDLCGRILAP